MDGDGVVAVQAALDQPLGYWRAPLFGDAAFCLAAFFVGDPPAGADQVVLLHALQEAEQRESRRPCIVLAFDSMIGAPYNPPHPLEQA
ncbi:hypothetical protein AB0D40_41595 [Streptomyces massasporeus]|uniref:hypothetical protein n=1 Tax=Streptomyces massasporeus TaxID=67324 RepID=UPI00340EB80E